MPEARTPQTARVLRGAAAEWGKGSSCLPGSRRGTGRVVSRPEPPPPCAHHDGSRRPGPKGNVSW